MASEWQSITIQVPGKDILEPVREVLETLLTFLDVLRAILDTIKVFLIDFGNPIKALVEALIKLIQELFLSLKATGAFAYNDIPDLTKDPNLNGHYGGFSEFSARFKGSLFDSRDFSRPQPRPGSTTGGYVVLVVDASQPFQLITRVKQLLRFFGKEFASPRYEAPENAKAIPVGADGDPILAVADVFAKAPIEAIQLQWTLPSNQVIGDQGFTDVVNQVVSEFIPPKFLIERSTANPIAQKIDISKLGDPTATGLVEFDRETEFTVSGSPAKRVFRKETLKDEQGEEVLKFQKYVVLDQTDISGILGQLGKFRYIDTDVEADKTYYYRIRALSGNLNINNNAIAFPTSVDKLERSPETKVPLMRWPGETGDDAVVMGKPTGILSASVPKDMGDFDVFTMLKKVFQTAFTLDFHLAAREGVQFDAAGNPTGTTSAIEVGRGSLVNFAGVAAAFQSVAVIDLLASGTTINQGFNPDPITGKPPQMPWQKFVVRRQAARVADIVASAFLENGSGALEGFRSIMQGPYPKGSPESPEILNPFGDPSPGNLEDVVNLLTKDLVAEPEVTRYYQAYVDVPLRLNILTVVNFLKSFAFSGAPPNWIAVSPLRDIIPWSGQFLYDLLDKIQALLDAFKGAMDEIRQFIELLERKIDALERFIRFLIDILNFIESLEISAYILAVPEVSGTVSDWAAAYDQAEGDKPPDNPSGFAAGVALAYVAPDVTAIRTAFGIIFGV